MPSTHVLIEVSTSDPEKEKILTFLKDSQNILSEGANLFYRSPDYCIFCLTDGTNYWVCFYGFPKAVENNSSSQILNFFEKRVSSYDFKFPEIPRPEKSQRYREIRSISGVVAGFTRAFGTKSSVHALLGDGDYIKELWKSVINRKTLPPAPWEMRHIHNDFFNTSPLDDTLEKNQRLKRLEHSVRVMSIRLHNMETIMQADIERQLKEKGINIDEAGRSPEDVNKFIEGVLAQPESSPHTPTREELFKETLDKKRQPAWEDEDKTRTTGLCDESPQTVLKSNEEAERENSALFKVAMDPLNDDKRDKIGGFQKRAFSKFDDLVVGTLPKNARLSRKQCLKVDEPIWENPLYDLILDYWLARQTFGAISKTKFFSSEKISSTYISFRKRHLESITWDGSLKDSANKNCERFRVFLEENIDNGKHENNLTVETVLKSKLPGLIQQGRQLYLK